MSVRSPLSPRHLTQNHLTRRQFLAGMTAVGGVAILAGCATPAATQTGAESPGEETVTLVVDTRTSEVPFMEDTFEWFQEEHPNTAHEIRGYPGGDFFTKVLSLAAAGEEGDLIWGNISGGQYLNFGLKGIVVALDDFVEAEDYDLSSFFPATVETGRFEDKLYALPLSGMPSNRPLFYNTELMDGVEYDITQNWDWTIEDLIAAGETLTQREGDEVRVWGYAPDTSYFGLVPWLRTFGGDLLSDDGRTCVINSDAGIECVQFLWSVSNELGIAPKPDQVQDSVGDMWMGGNIAITHRSTGNLSSIKDAVEFEYGASVMPRHPVAGRSDMIGAHHLGVGAKSAHQDLAWALAKHYCTQEVGIYKLHTPSGMPAARPDVYTSEDALAIHPGFAPLAEAGQWAKMHTVPWNLRGREVIDTLHNNMDKIWLGEIGIEDGLALVQDEIQIVLDKPQP